jgi:hypothetical protein
MTGLECLCIKDKRSSVKTIKKGGRDETNTITQLARQQLAEHQIQQAYGNRRRYR